MLSEGLELRPMDENDIPAVVEMIAAIDEDDAEEASESYTQRGLENQFVLARDGKLLGVTGCRPAAGTHQTFWLSWTYMQAREQGKGLGSQMLQEMLQRMRDGNIRKVFVSTSDYKDSAGADAYAAARQMYENAGFILEVTHPQYYAPGESQLIYGLALQEIRHDRQVASENECVFFNGLNEIDETEGMYVINWAVKRKRLFGRNEQFTKDDLDIGIAQARQWNARALFISFPSNIPGVIPPLELAGFFEEGRLKDYYEDGVDEIHFRCNLE